MNDIQYQYINPEPLLEAVGGDADACRHMFATFANSATAIFARLDAAIVADDQEQVRREAHSLKSSTALVGASELTALLKDIEQATKAEPALSAQPQLPRLRTLFAGIESEVRHYIDQVG